MQPRLEPRFGVSLQKTVKEGGIGLWAKSRWRDQHQRQRLHARLLRQGHGDSAAERVADEMRGADPFFDERGARRFDQRLEARFLAERRESMARQVDRQRRLRLGQKAMNGSPAVQIGAKAGREQDRRAPPPLKPKTMHFRPRRRGAELLHVGSLNAPVWAGSIPAPEPQATLPRDASR